VLCANVGVAHAKDVRIEWEYDILAFVALIAELDGELATSIVLDQTLLRIGDDSRYSMHMVESQATQRFPAIAPGPITSATRLGVPPAYVQLLGIYLGELVEALPQLRTVRTECPELKLIIRYRDIGNNRHTRRFVVLPKLQSMRTGVSGGDGTQKFAEVQAYFEVREG
jgi:hypothetical protein